MKIQRSISITHNRNQRGAEVVAFSRQDEGWRTRTPCKKRMEGTSKRKENEEKTERKVHTSLGSKRESIGASSMQVAYIHLLLPSFLLAFPLSLSPYPFSCSRRIELLFYLPISLTLHTYTNVPLPANPLLENIWTLKITYLAVGVANRND